MKNQNFGPLQKHRKISSDPTRVCLLIFLLLALPSSILAAETVILNITVNQIPKGEFFVPMTDDGDFLVKVEDLKTIGIREPKGKVVEVSAEPYLSLKSMGGVTFQFNERTLTLDVTVPPELLPKTVLNFMPQRQPGVYYPKDSGAFFNYGLRYYAGNSFDFQNLDAPSELGIRVEDFLFLSDSSYQKTTNEERFTRLNSRIVYDRRQDLQRVTLGDSLVSSGDLGSGVNLGGLSFSKIYAINPYLIRRPLFDYSGLVALPSDAEIYLDGNLVRKEKLMPGEFELKDISYYGGNRNVEVVIRDAFGREQRIQAPFFFTDVLLKEGLHEYSYNLGFLREQFGVISNSYGDPVFLAFHRYGLFDWLNLGFRGEGKEGLYNAGPLLTLRLSHFGVVDLALAGSTGRDGRNGTAGTFSYVYQDRYFNARALLRGYTKDYSTLQNLDLIERPKYEAGIGGGYGSRTFGSLSVDYSTLKQYQGQDRSTTTLSYSRTLWGKMSVSTSLRRIEEQQTSYEFLVNLIFFPQLNLVVSANYQNTKDGNTETLQAQKNAPTGEGIGYRTTLQRMDSSSDHSSAINPFFQYNSKYGIYAGEYRGVFNSGGRNETYSLFASGGMAYVGNTLGFSRPITDSFGLVKVGELKGVAVYQNNQEIGRTNSAGKVFIPSMNSFLDNQVRINDKDIPMEYSIAEVQRFVSPPLRSGTVINFKVTKIQAITGQLKMRIDGEMKPAEYMEVILLVEGPEMAVPTGKGGEFYFENVPAGTYKATFKTKGKACSFNLTIPKSDEMMLDLGELICEDMRELPPERTKEEAAKEGPMSQAVAPPAPPPPSKAAPEVIQPKESAPIISPPPAKVEKEDISPVTPPPLGESPPEDAKSKPAKPAPGPPVIPEAKENPEGAGQTPPVYYVTTERANLRAEPDTRGKKILTLKKGARLKKISDSGDWIKVELPSGEKGWVHKELLFTADDLRVTPSSVYLVTTKNAHLRAEPNAQGKSLVILKEGRRLKKIAEAGDWCYVQLPKGETGWIHKDLVKEVDYKGVHN